MFKHIIWDFDGTLFDTYPVINQVLGECFLEQGIDETIAEITRLTRISMKYTMKYYENKYAVNKEFWVNYNKKVKREELNCAMPFQGVRDVLRIITERGDYNYILTHRGESSFLLLENHGLLDYFKECITSKGGFARKPSPEAILYLLDTYKIKSEEAIMVGDRELDILSGKNAGIYTCYFNLDGVFDSKADYYIQSIEQIKDVIKT